MNHYRLLDIEFSITDKNRSSLRSFFKMTAIRFSSTAAMPGHISLYLPASKTLIAGDAVVIEDGRLAIANPHYTLNLEEALRSVQRLLDSDIEQLICYHGGLFHGDAKQALRQLIVAYRHR